MGETEEERLAREAAIEAFKARGGKVRQAPPRMAKGLLRRNFCETTESYEERYSQLRERLMHSAVKNDRHG